MKNIYNGWDSVKDWDINKVIDLIVTGKNIKSITPDLTIITQLGDPTEQLKILDFGCGIGRNSFAIANYSPNWNVIGYDNESMLSRRFELQEKYYNKKFDNLSFTSDWDSIKIQNFNIIICVLVLQHIYEDQLTQYISDFKRMTNKLIIRSRRFNDEMINNSYKNTFEILEKNGLYPTNAKDIKYNTYGNLEDHYICTYYDV